MLRSRSRPMQPQTKMRMQCSDGPRDDCKCYACHLLHDAEDSDFDGGLGIDDENLDFAQLCHHWGIAADLNFAQHDSMQHEENEEELLERRRYKQFVTQFERDLSEAREINFETFLNELINTLWEAMKHVWANWNVRFSNMLETWLRGRRIYPFNKNTKVKFYKYPYTSEKSS